MIRKQGSPGSSSGHGREQPQECANTTNTLRGMNARARAHSNTNQGTYADSQLVGFQQKPFIILFLYAVAQYFFAPKCLAL